MTVAADADVERAALFAQRISVPTLVDTRNDLARLFGYRAIPNGFAFGRDGTLIGSKIAAFEIRDQATRDLVETWVSTKGPAGDATPLQEPSPEALDLFAEGSRLMREGRRDEALAAWARAFEKDPKNFVIRKQIWRSLYPDRFGDPIDLAWHKEQIAREDEIGFRAANPALAR